MEEYYVIYEENGDIFVVRSEDKQSALAMASDALSKGVISTEITTKKPV